MTAETDTDKLGEKKAKTLMESFMDSGEERIFGFKVGEPWYTLFTVFSPRITSEAAKFGKSHIASTVSKAAETLKLGNSQKIGNIAGLGFSYLVPYIDNVITVVNTGRDHKKDNDWLFNQLSPLVHANQEARKDGFVGKLTGQIFQGGYEGNKMVGYATNVIKNSTFRKLGRNVAEAFPAIAINVKSAVQDQYDKAGTPVIDADGNTSTPTGKSLENKLKWSGWAVDAAGPLNAAIKKLTPTPKPQDVINKETSLGKVLEINKYMRHEGMEGCSKRTIGTSEVEEINKMVAEAFQKFQAEQHHAPFPKPSMQDTAKIITDALVYGELHPLSLVNIIGKEMLLLKDNKSDFIVKSEIDKVIDEQTGVLSKGSTVNVSKFMEDRPYTLEDVKRHIQSRDPDEVALATILHPEAVLKAAGMKKNQINAARHQLTERAVENMFIVIIDSLDALDKEELGKLGFDKAAQQFIRQHTGKPEEVINAFHSVGGDREKITDIARNAIMGEESSKWQEYIQAKDMERESPDKDNHHKERDREEDEYEEHRPVKKASNRHREDDEDRDERDDYDSRKRSTNRTKKSDEDDDRKVDDDYRNRKDRDDDRDSRRHSKSKEDFDDYDDREDNDRVRHSRRESARREDRSTHR